MVNRPVIAGRAAHGAVCDSPGRGRSPDPVLALLPETADRNPGPGDAGPGWQVLCRRPGDALHDAAAGARTVVFFEEFFLEGGVRAVDGGAGLPRRASAQKRHEDTDGAGRGGKHEGERDAEAAGGRRDGVAGGGHAVAVPAASSPPRPRGAPAAG
ncbi:hypothetical protein GCM10010218_59910 [Streptomyces mashuensis]|uniref:Uncharacterized protein n=1 Tax=Streptomyces mashuensis TaxID=33904 RepID=A0A919EGD4_9ACTN|nr:hypothetical protein GCM10010218_59910 [Streptomyces mashuensis]